MAMSNWNTPMDEVASVKVKEEIASEITPFEEVVLVKVKEEAAASDEEPQDDPLACGDDPLTSEDSVLSLAHIPYVDNQGTSTIESEEGPVAHIAAVFLDVKKEDATAHSVSSASETKPPPKKRGKRKMLFCHLCSFKSVRPSRLEIHMRTHTGERPFPCDLCDYRAADQARLRMHRMTHTGEKNFSCDLCDFKCIQIGNLKEHQSLHSGEKPHVCDICGYRTRLLSCFGVHKKKHLDQKPHACNICDFQCLQGFVLKEHMRLHTGEKPFACEFCSYRSHRKKMLQQHVMRMHTRGTRGMTFTCDTCDYEGDKEALKRHMRVHTGERPFACEECDYKAGQMGHLQTHMRLKHLKTHKKMGKRIVKIT